MGFRGFTGSNPVRPTMIYTVKDDVRFADYTNYTNSNPLNDCIMCGFFTQGARMSHRSIPSITWLCERHRLWGIVSKRINDGQNSTPLVMKNWIFT